jgi:hypothetical protein
MTSRRVGLTAAFLALAAGGTAACDDSSSYDLDPVGGYDGYSSSGSDASYSGSGTSYSDSSPGSSAYGDDDEVFYCADEDGTIVDEDYCDDESSSSGRYYLWHSPSYERGLVPGQTLDGGERFRPTDRKARTAFKLPATGSVRNGTIKTNVVGSGSRSTGSRSTGSRSTGSGSTGSGFTGSGSSDSGSTGSGSTGSSGG